MLKIGLAAMAACVLATPAMANADNDPFVKESVMLSLAGLDLSTVDGQNRLAIRMDNAARAVCGEGLDTVHLRAAASAQECRVEVREQIRNQIETRMAANTATAQPVQLASSR